MEGSEMEGGMVREIMFMKMVTLLQDSGKMT